ncbi:hypothetical protein [uncultured Arthrobacter sp.]|uniref:hypothetical protein n=1 Tax=uncultured Arthrobacter sp. TaxID=114050 RepID=UPI0025FBE838|nr:hypothetical protein [uncultured Arthrobacter sp.]
MTADNQWLPRVVRCARHDCKRTLTEDDAVQCPHGESFCGDCSWPEACLACAFEATFPGRIDPTSPAAYAWPDDSAAGLIREGIDHETGKRVERYAENRDDV